MTSGTCKLTGDIGKLVKSHIIPDAFTSPDPGGLPFAQGGTDHPPIKRWTSWYDPNIVTRKGEDILQGYDDWAISELRRQKLVWSGWEGADRLIADDFESLPGDEGWGFRRIKRIDGTRLRLFFLSLLWRAAVSELTEFQEIKIRPSDLRRLKGMVAGGNPLPLHRFPISLTQISTRGDVHNLTPLAQSRPRDILNERKGSYLIFRFYFDGIIAHFYRDISPAEVTAMGDMIVGAADRLTLGTVTFEKSWQRSNMDQLVREVSERWPDRLKRIPGFGSP